MREEIASLHKRIGITMIFVTHDQAEALVIADRIGVMRSGRLQQVGTPDEVYRHPINQFVASCVGEANFIVGALRRADGALHCDFGGGRILLSADSSDREGPGVVVLRPESIRITRERAAGTANCFPVTVQFASYLGATWRVTARLGDQTIFAYCPSELAQMVREPGATLYASWRQEDASAVPAASLDTGDRAPSGGAA